MTDTSIAQVSIERQPTGELRCTVCGHVGPSVVLFTERISEYQRCSIAYCTGPGMWRRHSPRRVDVH